MLFIIISILGCSKDDSSNETILVGNKYANLLFETRRECEEAQELYFINCAQVMEIINESEVEIYLTDILYRTNFYIKNNNLIVESTSSTYEFSEDLVFQILENGDLKLEEETWIKFEGDFYE
ncbi:hypothetical protein ML462_14625 [Gramella lutea]|uniref:Uncharacterized protein n=1 Tax=Christiangramia lutea TaxID=1607951 RepID=A0A9X1V5V3_9FLAO|nr:hypothetical protein [Christiangramia lutea]MCH4824405.1 hypothetical protein [Christiangramia lutea]